MNKYRGHIIYQENDIWFYKDTKEPVSENKNRACGHCDLPNTAEGHDGCLGTLPDVQNACCGHGSITDVYVQFYDYTRISGVEAREFINKHTLP
jgi:hypothetical protein